MIKFDQLKSLGDKASLYGYSYDHWKDSLEISQSLQNEIYGNYIDVHSDFASKAGTYYDTVQLPSLSLFIGLFIAIVFFVAAASFLYFRLFTDLDEDRERYRSLAKLASEREMAQSVTIQLAILFFFPFVIAVMHTLFALRTLAVEGYSDVAGPLSLTIGGFFIFQLLFFLAVRSSYLKKMNK